MTQLSKATDLYLRGFPSVYIKSRTGLSIQAVLKRNLAEGRRYTKSSIIEYQVDYIRQRFNTEAIEESYRVESAKHDDLYAASRKKKIRTLGCGFGAYAKVIRTLLGDNRYNALRNECWSVKQKRTVRERYGVDNVFDKTVIDTVVHPEAVAEGRLQRTRTLNERYGVDHPNQDPETAAQMQRSLVATMRERHGVDYPSQRPEVAVKIAEARQRTMTERYGAPNTVQVDELREKIFTARKLNGTLSTSEPENALYLLLCEVFGEEDVRRNVVVDDRYPYHVDFYIVSRDLFIELNGDRCHNDHWYDAGSKKDQQTVRSWCENAERLEQSNGKPSRYRNYVRVWTVTDVAKRQSAERHSLNYLVFWDGANHMRKKKRIPRLRDVWEWIDAGCPDSSDYKLQNTY